MGAWQEIVDYTVPSNTTSFTVNNFGTITKNDFVKVVATFNAVSSYIDVNMTANSSSITNYHTQSLQGDSNTTPASRSNRATIHWGNTTTSPSGNTIGYLKLSENDRVNMFFNDFRRNKHDIISVVPGLNFLYSTSSGATFPSGITSFTFATSPANSMVAGTRIQIYKLAAEKVADITVGSNTTQVDISSLSIDKDSEYLLLSDITPTSGTNIVLGVNDVTATNQYYYQGLGAFGSTTYAIRENQGLMIYLPTGQKGLVHSHIKLSNIGAFTGQHYGFQDYGTAAPTILNRFQVSTTESITSITKLNILAQTTNAIQAGSRFILYKLYE